MRGVRAVATAVGVFVVTAAAVADDAIALGEPFKARMAAPRGGPKGGNITSDSVEVQLKSGQKVEAIVSVTGEDRKTGVALFDPNGALLATSWAVRGGESNARNSFSNFVSFPKKNPGAGKSAKLSVGEVPATGKYTVTVYSDLAGDYTLLVRDPSKPAAARDADTIRRELKEARQRVEELERELKEKEKGEKPEEAPRPAAKVRGKG